MAMSFDAQCKAAARSLQAMADAIDTQALGDAVEDAAEIFVDEAQRHVTVRSGDLRDDIKNKAVSRGKARAREMVYVDSRYAHLVEYGHAAPRRLVVPRQGKALKTGSEQFAASSPGGAARAFPFMRPALDSKEREMGRVIAISVKRVAGRARKSRRKP